MKHGNPSLMLITWKDEDLHFGRPDPYYFSFYPSLPRRERLDVGNQTVTHAVRTEAYEKVLQQWQDVMDLEAGKVGRRDVLTRAEVTKLWHRRERAMPRLVELCDALSIWTEKRSVTFKWHQNIEQANNIEINQVATLRRIPITIIQNHPLTIDALRRSQLELIPFDDHRSGWSFTIATILHGLGHCSGCLKSFTTMAALQDHLKHLHSMLPTTTVALTGRKHCPECIKKSRTFDARGLRAHILAVHTSPHGRNF
ncbi:hypothetical protein DL96DRAFT_995732 [Flagelloscypha sp. PMI_526]|nr:hypothetical protein DL96DRAFT_995732 [Flagelloscypha sp. PMI_526]